MNKAMMSNGNTKIGNDTMIFNLTSAMDCPAKKLGLCKICKQCYARKAEYLYPNVLPYRRRQAKYWDATPLQTRIEDFTLFLKRKRIPVKYFRWNESGDFKNLNDIREVIEIAKAFPKIKFYTYTHRTDLITMVNRKRIPRNLNINVSNKKYKGLNEFKAVKEYSKGANRCKGNCRICSLCKTNKDITIEVLMH